MKILITGVTGFIGRNLSKYLLDRGYEIYAIVRNSKNVDKRIKTFSYSKIDKLISFFKKERFDGVIHLASLFLSNHQPKDIENLIDSNIKFGIEILESCKYSDVKWFINTGTFWQHYNNADYNPVNLYAATKEAFEVIAKYYVETSNLVFTSIKLNDTFGPNDTRNKIFNLWIEAIKNNTTLDMSEGEQIIDISYIEDIVSAYECMIENLSKYDYKKYNMKNYVVSNNQKLTLKELAQLFENVVGKELKIKWGARDYREREVMVPYNKGELVPNWKQKYLLEEAIRKTIKEIM